MYTEQQSEPDKKTVFEELILTGKRPPIGPLLILGFLTTVFILFVPLLIIVMVSGGFRPGHFFGIAVAVIPGAFFLRLLLWNLYGREVIQIEADGIRSFCDYKYFIGRKKYLPGKLFYLDVLELEGEERDTIDLIDELTPQSEVKFGIRNDEGIILSHFFIPKSELNRFKNRVNSLGKTLPKIQ